MIGSNEALHLEGASSNSIWLASRLVAVIDYTATQFLRVCLNGPIAGDLPSSLRGYLIMEPLFKKIALIAANTSLSSRY